MLPARTVTYTFLLILTSTRLPYKRDNVVKTKRNPKIEQYINLKKTFEKNGRSNQSQRITESNKSG